MVKVIPHQKKPKTPRPYRAPKLKRYCLEYFLHSENKWKLKADYRTAWNAKYMARWWEKQSPHFKWRVIDTRR